MRGSAQTVPLKRGVLKGMPQPGERSVSAASSSELHDKSDRPSGEIQREYLLKTGALQDAIFHSAYFSSIATDEKGVIQIFNVGAERMLGYAAADVVDKITPAEISDREELVTRAAT